MNPEKAVDYLARINWKSLVEWLTAEVILNRPNDPVQFSRDILGLKLSECASEYQPDQVTGWLRSCYTEAAALVDESGVIHGKSLEAAPQSLAERVDILQKKCDAIDRVIESCTDVLLLNRSSVLEKLVKETSELLRCEAVELFTFDDNLRSWTIRDSEDNSRRIKISRGEGIVGAVGDGGDVANIKDAYTDPRFDQSSDRDAGRRTKTILCVPMHSPTHQVVGVLQSVNKFDGLFTSLDEYIADAVGRLGAVAVLNEDCHRNAQASIEKFRSTLAISSAVVSGNYTANEGDTLLAWVTTRAASLIAADRSALYLVDAISKALFAIQEQASIRVSIEQGIVAECIAAGVTINISDAYEHPSFNPAGDRKSGYRTKSVLSVPLRSKGNIIGVLQFVNKSSGGGLFTKEDEEVMGFFGQTVASTIMESELFVGIQGRGRAKAKGADKFADSFDPLEK